MSNRTLACSVLLALALGPLGAQPDPSKEELKLKLPKPMFIGTPTNLRSPNLEKVTGKSRGPFYVPKGTVLLSLNKKVTSSDSQPVIGELDMITDGEKGGGDGFFVELGPTPQWVADRSRRVARALTPSSSGTITARRASTATSSSRCPTMRPSRPV